MNAKSIAILFLVLIIAASGLTACASTPNKEAAAAATVAAARSTEAAAEATKAAAAQTIAQATSAIQASPTGVPAARATQRPIQTATAAPTQAAIRTATAAPAQSPTPAAGTAEPQGQKFYLNADGVLALTPPPANSQSHTECLSECIKTWAITLTQPLQGNAYGYRLVSISGSYNVRLLHTRGGQQTVLAEWLNRSGWQGGPQLDAQPGDVLTLEITAALGAVWRPKTLPVAAGSLLAYDYGSYSYVTVGTTPTSLPTFAPPLKPTPVGMDTSAAVQIRYGDAITQEIKPSGNVDTYVFDGKSGDIALIAAAGTADAPWLSLRIRVSDPQGQPVGNESYGNGEFKLAADGRYAFTVRESGTRVGPYNVALKNAAPGAGVKIGYGAVVTEAIRFAGEVDVYAFAGKIGDAVHIALTDMTDNGRANVTAELLDPQGKSLASCDVWVGDTATIRQTLTANGEHAIKIHITGQLDTPRTGPYVFLLKNVAPIAGIKMTYGAVVTGTIAPQGDVDVYTFEWRSGEAASIEVNAGHWSNKLNVEIFDSRGNSLAVGVTSWSNSAQAEMVQVKPSLTDNGIYTVVIQGAKDSKPGDYTLSLKNLAAP